MELWYVFMASELMYSYRKDENLRQVNRGLILSVLGVKSVLSLCIDISGCSFFLTIHLLHRPQPFRLTKFTFLHGIIVSSVLQVDNGDLRPYSHDATKTFISDLRDGFFPSELKASDPDGLLIHAIDHR